MGLLDWLVVQGTRRLADDVRKRVGEMDDDPARQTWWDGDYPWSYDPYAQVQADWIAAGEPVTIADIRITSGLFYVGAWLFGEPSLIEPKLRARPGQSQPLDFWPTYHGMSIVQRHAYLTWLAGNRRDPETDIGNVFLFFYGLERRALVELAPDSMEHDATVELNRIHAETDRLLALYGSGSASFAGHARAFLDLLDVIIGLGQKHLRVTVPPLAFPVTDIPPSVRIAIGTFAKQGAPIPAEWALRWAWYFPETRLHAPAQRCPDDVARLFTLRYRERFGAGLTTAPGTGTAQIAYDPANSTLQTFRQTLTSTPNTFERRTPARKVATLLQEVIDELDSYSRWLGRSEAIAGALTGLALLPAGILDADHPKLQPLASWLATVVDDPKGTAITGHELIIRTLGQPSKRLSKAKSQQVAAILAVLGYGVEPDARIGGAAIPGESSIVLFRSDDGIELPTSPAYDLATIFVHLSALVGTSDSALTAAEADALDARLSKLFTLTTAERDRLRAHLRWLVSAPVSTSGLKTRLARFSPEHRAFLGDVLVSISTADIAIQPAEIDALRRVFRMLGLDPATITSKVHATLTTGSAARPQRRSSARRLDPERIRRTQQETAEVSDLLAGIFVDEPVTIPTPPPEPEAASTIDGLDAVHARLATALAAHDAWTREAYEELAGSFGLMPAGALDTLNEWALDAIDEPLADDEGGGIRISDTARKDLIP